MVVNRERNTIILKKRIIVIIVVSLYQKLKEKTQEEK